MPSVPTSHIVARARAEASEAKLLRPSADRVVNAQEIGGRRPTNPSPETVLEPGTTIIAIGTDDRLDRLHAFVTTDGRRAELEPESGPNR